MPRNELQVDKPKDEPKEKRKEKPKVDRQIWGLPKILTKAEVWVRKPSNPSKLEQIANPLASFTFPSDSEYIGTGRKKIVWEDTNVIPQPKPEVRDLT